MQWSFDLVGLWLKVEICRLNNNFAQYKEAGVSGDHDTFMHYGFDSGPKTGALETRLQLIPYLRLINKDGVWRRTIDAEPRPLLFIIQSSVNPSYASNSGVDR